MSQLPSVAVVVTHSVSNYDQWKRAFDAHQPARKAAGVLGHHINRGADDPNQISIYLPGVDRRGLEEFIGSPGLKAAMADASVTSAPQVTWVKPVEDNHIGDRPTAAMMVSHPVESFAAWKTAYDSARGLRAQHGVIGAAVNQAIDNPNQVLVYHQAETLAELKALVASPELKSTMKQGGVTAPPQIQFVNAVEGAAY